MLHIIEMPHKILLVSGCSFTAVGQNQVSWADVLAKDVGLTVINLAFPGAGNQHIANSVICYLKQHDLDPKDVLIGVMWSGILRRDWIRDSHEPNNYLYTDYHYTPGTRLAFPQEIVHNLSGKNIGSVSQSWQLKLLDIAYGCNEQFNKKSRALESLLAIDHLNQYLDNNGFDWFQTHFYDPMKDRQNNPFRGTNYQVWVNELNMPFDHKNFLALQPYQYLGDFAESQGLTYPDHHPTELGHERWTREILMPNLPPKCQ